VLEDFVEAYPVTRCIEMLLRYASQIFHLVNKEEM